jgi:hypothetical protein
MRVLLSRRTRLAFFAVGLLCLFLQVPLQAATPYSINDATEGDPGDGVLRPRSDETLPALAPEHGSVAPETPVADQDIGVVSPLVNRLPLLVYLPGLGWCSLAPAWLIIQGRWTDAP